MKTQLSALTLLLLAAGVVSAQDAVLTPEFKLTLRPVGPPLPSLRYELLPNYREQTKGNAAVLYHRALHTLSDTRSGNKKLAEQQTALHELLQKPLSEIPKDSFREYVQSNRAAYRELEAAAKCEHCDWGLDERISKEGIGLLLPEVQKIREIAFALKVRCRAHITEGKVELALRDVQTGFVLSRHTARGSTLINFLVGVSVCTLFIEELEYIMQLPDCPNLYWSLTALPRPLHDLAKGIEGELRSQEAFIPQFSEVDKGPLTVEQANAALDRWWESYRKFAGDEESASTFAGSRLAFAAVIAAREPGARKSLLAAGKKEADLKEMPAAQIVMLDSALRFRNLRDEYFVWFDKPYAEAMQGMRQAAAVQEAPRRDALDLLGLSLRMLLPALEKVYMAQVRTERRLASLRTVEAIRLHAAKTGKLPTTLADIKLVPVPSDPVTGKPFPYSVTGQNFTVTAEPPPGEKQNQGNNWKYVIALK